MRFLQNYLLNDKKFEEIMEKEKAKSTIRERKRLIREEKSKHRNNKKVTTSKLLLVVAFLISVEILVFCEIAYFFYPDSGILTALIGVPITIVPISLGYLRKATAENTVGGIVYESAMTDCSQTTGIGN